MEDVFDRRAACNRFLGEYAKFQRKGARELALEIDRAATHARDYSGVFDFRAFEFDQDDGLARTEEVRHYADDFEVELLDLVAGEDRVGIAMHSRLDLAEGQDFVGLREKRRCQGEAEARC